MMTLIFFVCVCKNLVVRLASWLTLPSICCVWISFSLFIADESVWPGRAEPSWAWKLAGTLKSVRFTCKTSISDEKYIITGDQKYNKHGRKKRLLSIVFAGANVAKRRQLLKKNKTHTTPKSQKMPNL